MAEGGESRPSEIEIAAQSPNKIGPALKQITDPVLRRQTHDAFRKMMDPHENVATILKKVDAQINEIENNKNEKKPRKTLRRTLGSKINSRIRRESEQDLHPTKIENETSALESERMPDLDPNMHLNFGRTVSEVLEKVGDHPESATLDDLTRIIDAEKEDLMVQTGSRDRLGLATGMAEKVFDRKNPPDKTNVFLIKNKKGEWMATTKNKKGSLKFTFSKGTVAYAKNVIQNHKSNLNTLDYAKEAIKDIDKGKTLIENDFAAQSLDVFLGEKLGAIQAAKASQENDGASNNNDLLVNADRSLALFNALSNKVDRAKTSIEAI